MADRKETAYIPVRSRAGGKNMQENERLVTTEIRINREHKDRLFRLIFGKEEYKQNLLELYNALNDTSYNNLDDLKITTIEDVVYMGMKNDVSMLIHSRMALFEHQSTYNPNMPIRGFMYAARLYNKYIEENKLSIYGKTMMKLPTPQYIVFYNGDEEHEDDLRKHRAEVMDVCITEYNEERVLDAIREESYMEGREEGREEGYAEGCEITEARDKVQAVENVMESLNVSAEEACKILQYLPEDYEAAKALVGN